MNINVPSCAAGEAAKVLSVMFGLDQTVMLWGPPGVGKSSLVESVAQKLNARFIDVRLATKTAADIGGLPAINHETRTTEFYLPEFLPREKGPGILFFDELPGADEQTRIAVYGLMLERRLGNYELPPDWMIIAAGNREVDAAYSAGLGTALNNRLVHLVVEPEISDWTKWAVGKGIDSRVIAFLNRNPHRLHNAAEAIRSRQAVFATPRAWERVSAQVQAIKSSEVLRLTVAGTVGDEIAVEFFSVLDELSSMASVDEILRATGEKLKGLLPRSLSGFYSLGYALAARIPAISAQEEREKVVENDIARMWRLISFLKRWKPDDPGLPIEEIRTFLSVLLCDRLLETGRDIGDNKDFAEWNNDMQVRQMAA